MTKRSGVNDSKGTRGGDEKRFDHEASSLDLLDELAKGISEDVILETGKTHRHQVKIRPLIHRVQLKATC
jgi:hypothetical protein